MNGDGLLPSCTEVVLSSKNVRVANSFFQRLIGLVGRGQLHENEGLLIVPCNSVHTFFMRYRIDVVFLSRDFRVVKVIHNMKPWRISAVVWKSHSVLELQAGAARRLGIAFGVTLRLV
jgi:uncharacterized membrane protein (UPF0127 family)